MLEKKALKKVHFNPDTFFGSWLQENAAICLFFNNNSDEEDENDEDDDGVGFSSSPERTVKARTHTWSGMWFSMGFLPCFTHLFCDGRIVLDHWVESYANLVHHRACRTLEDRWFPFLGLVH